MRIAGWSGPRNLSTAMMYAFAARPDFAVLDEPFYGAYLQASGVDHPMRDAVLASMSCDPAAAARQCARNGSPHVYQKHMIHHMLDGFPLDWCAGAAQVFLIRHPARVVASYAARRERATPADLGFERQWDLFRRLCDAGHDPVVISSEGIRADPRAALAALCAAIGLPFDPAMLGWAPGGIAQDGVWAAHWYGSVHTSTGFAGVEGPVPVLDDAGAALAALGMPAYERLLERALA